MQLKKCRKCKEKLEISSFPKMNIGKFGVWSTCNNCLHQNKKPYTIKKTPLKQIWIKRKIRIQNKWSEIDIFRVIWSKREHKCELCNKKLNNAKVHNFDHIIPKSKWEKYRLDINNIQLICFKCHFEKTHWLIYKWIDMDS